MAIWRRRPPAGQTVHHSDHGSQYTSGRSGGASAPPACSARWARSATPTTTPWPSRSSRSCSVSSSTNTLGDPPPARAGRVRMDRSLVQPAPPAHLDRLAQPDRLRDRPSRRTARGRGMSPTGSRNRALRCPQRPATTAGGINTPDDPSLCGPSPTPHPNRPGNRGMVIPRRTSIDRGGCAVRQRRSESGRASTTCVLELGQQFPREVAMASSRRRSSRPSGLEPRVRISVSSNVRWAAFGGIRKAPDRTRASTTSSSMNDPPAATWWIARLPGGRLVNPVL